MLRFNDGNTRVTFRASGTEPKIKYYAEMKASYVTSQERNALRARLESIVKVAVDQLLDPKRNGLKAASG